MCKILSRIKTLADTEGISIGAIERAIGASRGVISKAITKGTDIQAKWLELICDKFPQYSPIWLLTGEGSMLRSEIHSARITPLAPTQPPTEINFAQSPQKLSQSNSNDALIGKFLETIQQQAEEIGRLKERIAQLEREKNEPSESFQTAPEVLSTSPVD